jgi:radical SAM protein with 4Fe4S-binding SPASM domain
VFWETTKACNLSCRHCRAVPQRALGPTELTTRRAFDLIDEIARIARPVMVLSGGEPLFRPDLFDIAEYGVESGFRMALATNGTLVDERVAAKIADAGFSRVAISLDGARAETHDRFRGVSGSHQLALRGLRNLREEEVSIQINSTIARHNAAELPGLLDLALELGADALHLFMLVPVGCGLEIAPAEMLPADEYERVLHWFDDQSKTCPIDLKATCAPHYYRIRAQRLAEDRSRGDRTSSFIAPGTKANAAPAFTTHDHAGAGHGQALSAMTRGCLAGTSVCFVSNDGRVYPCGYLPVSAGDTRAQRFADIWNDSPVFRALRDPDALEGKCHDCRYQALCGGCRARAYAATGSFLAEEPFCSYQPDKVRRPVTLLRLEERS